MLNAKTVFVLAPHPDDAEICCGGTIAKLVEGGSDVYVLVFAKDDDRRKEFLRASTVLGIKRGFTFEVPIRNFFKYRQKILDKLIQMRDQYKPDLVIQPSLDDVHQDHIVIANEGVRAFRQVNLIGFETRWSNINFNGHLFVSLTEGQIVKKLKAVSCYKSQSHKPYCQEKYLRGQAEMNGVAINVDYCEVFSMIRGVVK